MRTGPFNGQTPIVIVPGGPGISSVAPYSRLRAWAKKSHIDLIMVEHRGIGLSRRTTSGADLTEDNMSLRLVVDDLVAVLDAEQVPHAVLYGSSYGTYVVQAFAAEHPDRTAGLVLDSAMLTAHDHVFVREAARRILWEGVDDETARIADKLRTLISDGTVTQQDAEAVARIVYEFCGADTLDRFLNQIRAGRGDFAWRRIAALNAADTGEIKPFLMEFDLVGVIAFRELNYAPEPDGGPFDPGASFAQDAARFPAFQGETFDLKGALSSLQALRTRAPRAVIAEIKKASPSKGLIRGDFDVAWLAQRYAAGGAACLSVLTDRDFFAGDNDFLAVARDACTLPVLRKDFIIDPIQIDQSRALGADCILLIAAALSTQLMHALAERAFALGMDVLAEVHDAEELKRTLTLPAQTILGINNRDLRTFETTLETSIALRRQVDADRLLVSESGIHTPADLATLSDAGFSAFLIGESFMRAPDPGKAISALIEPQPDA